MSPGMSGRVVRCKLTNVWKQLAAHIFRVEHGRPNFSWRRATTVNVGRFAHRKWENYNKWKTHASKLLCVSYIIYIIYTCRRRPHKTTWWAAGWRPKAQINMP